jgi:monoamine oxidase
MLKNKGISFNPALSNEKLAAIESIGIGTMNKVFLKFNENFWYEDAYFLEHLQEDSSQIIEFFSPAPTGTPNILVAVFSGQQARSIEHMDNMQVKELLMNELKAMFGEDIPEPIAMEKTTWHTHPFALGSYPHLKPGSDISACDIIATPLDNKVFFAGDATSKKYMSTAHGAYLSGISAAESIIINL